MTTNLQKALLTYLTERLASLGQTLTVVCANSREEVEPRDPRLVLHTRSFAHVAGPSEGSGGLYTAEMALTLETPVLPAQDNAAHCSWEALAMTIMTPPPGTELEDALFAQALVFCGMNFIGWEDSPTQSSWGSAAVWRLGLQLISLADLETFVRATPPTTMEPAA